MTNAWQRLRRWRWERGILTGRWTEAEVSEIERRAAELAERLRPLMGDAEGRRD